MNKLENLLLEEIGVIDRKINSLTAERDALMRQLIKVRQHYSSTKDGVRKDSTNRLVAEQLILDSIRGETKPVQTSELFKIVKDLLPSMQYGAFRTYLHRMKEKELIRSSKRGQWELWKIDL